MIQRVEQGSDSQDQNDLESGTGQRQIGSVCFREWDKLATVRLSMLREWGRVATVSISMFQRVGEVSDIQVEYVKRVSLSMFQRVEQGGDSQDQYVLESGTGKRQ